jgi:hypothetical protein
VIVTRDIGNQAVSDIDGIHSHSTLVRKTNSSVRIDARIVDPLTDSSWDRLVLSRPGFNFFHRTAWAKVLCRTYGHKPFYLQLRRGEDVVGLVPIMEVVSPFTGRRGVSMPFSDLCEPVFSSKGGSEPSLFDAVRELTRDRRWRYFELRGGRDSLPRNAVAAEKFYGHKLDLAVGIEQLFGRFQSAVRRAIRKAENSGLTVEVTKSWEAMRDFYRLHTSTRRRHGLPPQPFSFFRNIQKEIIDCDLGFTVQAKHNGISIAAAVFFHSGEEALFKFGASSETIQHLRGNNLVMSEGIKHLISKGLKMLHFGRTEVNNQGLRRFKLSWGTQEGVIEYFRFALNPQKWLNSGRNASGFHNQLFRSLPLAVNRVAGALIYPHLD